MFLSKWMSSIGIGSTTVQTHLSKNQYCAGERVRGEVVIRGGQSDQEINDIYLYIVTEYKKVDSERHIQYIFKKVPLSERLIIAAQELKRIPFQFRLPLDLPMSTGHFPIYLKTVLDIKMALDPRSQERITVFPAPDVQKILKEIEDADFILYKIENLHEPGLKPHPFFQCFQFRPAGLKYGFIDEFHVIFDYNEVGISIEMEIHRAERVLSSIISWEHHDPEQTLKINDQPIPGDPFMKLRELLNRAR